MILGSLVKNISLARSGVYFLESLPIALINRFFGPADLAPPTNEQVRLLWTHIEKLHAEDARNIEERVYPLRALEIENPLRHARSYLEVLSDGVRVVWRMRANKTKEFRGKSAEAAKNKPEYYARNFHFQTDGYLSEASARRYDHQVEILFSGTAGAMRRLILPVLKHAKEGRWLEIGCGAGSATRPVLATFPKSHVTAMDLSASYLKIAQESLREFDNVDFNFGDAANLEFKDGTFDCVYSVYLLHELPKDVREQIVREAFRVLKPGGLLVFADSLQKDDNPELNWALERFPKVYHEPFYKNYSLDKMESLLKRMTGQIAESKLGFFTKVAWVRKGL